MATIQCKMCGGVLNLNAEVVATCPHCGTAQTLPNLTDPLRTQHIDQINHLRQNKDFDQAETMCRQLLDANQNEAEIHWLIALCRYGVVYVNGKDTGKYVPTVQRPQDGAFCEDDNYRAALQCAADAQRPIYSQEAQLIDRQIFKNREQALLSSRNNWKRYCTAAIAMAVLFAGGMVYSIWDCALSPRNQYNDAVELMEAGKYQSALTTFRSLFSFGEIEQQVQKCTELLSAQKYETAQKHLDAGDVVGAYDLWISLGNYQDSADKAAAIYDDYQAAVLKETKVGDTLYLGTYKQSDPKGKKEVIEWVVLDIQDGKALIITKNALSAKPFHKKFEQSTWETSFIRSWLDTDFINTAFSEDELARIVPTAIPAASASEKETQNRVFLLSAEEVQKYFPEGTAGCAPTATAKSIGSYVYEDSSNCWWWLRTQGTEKNSAVFVDGKGDIRTKGNRYDYGSGSVRPALWITLVS